MPGARTGAAALPAADRLVVHPRRPPIEHVVHRPLRRRADPLGHGVRQRAEAHVGDALAHLDVAGADRGRGTRGDDRPRGATTCTGRSAPPFAGIVGSVTRRSANATALTVTASTALTLPGRCASVPVKSNVISSPVDRDPHRDPAPAASPTGRRSSRARPRTRRRRRAARASAARMRRSPYATTSSNGAPRELDGAASTPSRFAPPCASRSPRRSSGVRDAATKIASTSGVSAHRRDAQPLLVDLGRVRRHRTGRHAAEVGVVGAVRGPADAACRRPANAGATSVMSLRCVPPANGSLTITWSPGREPGRRTRRSPRAPPPASSRGAPGCARPARAACRRR